MKALLIVDAQNDFMPGGALGVPEGNQIISVINALLEFPFDFILATKDWHPKEHGSFADNHGKAVGEWVKLSGQDQILWPRHCVQNTDGAEFAPGWDTAKVHKVFHKGTDKEVDSYSAFFDNAHLRATGLGEFLKENKVKELFIVGLATDYCVKYTVNDALKLGIQSTVIVDGCRGIDLKEGDVAAALTEMEQNGAKVVTLDSISTLVGS